MADITMCTGDDCPLKENCYRFTAEASKYLQSYFLTSPFDGKTCNSYWGKHSESIYNQLKPKNYENNN
jgi:hypothetical protein